MSRYPVRALLIITATVWLACNKNANIPGTTVVDTPFNREILDVCEKYRHAMEARDGGALLALAHPNYYEDGGTPKGEDDYGYEGLKSVLANRLSAVKTLRYNIEYRKIDTDGQRVRIDFRYDESFQLSTAVGDRWERKQNDKRMELEKKGERWLIISGM